MAAQGNTKAITEQATRLAEPLAEDMGYGVVDVEFARESDGWRLRVYIDKTGGVFIEDCERFSRAYSDALDRKDFIPHSYVLEVSSPGIDRPLKTDADFSRHCGEFVEAWLTRAERQRRRSLRLGNEDYIFGKLLSREDGLLVIEDEKGRAVELPMESVSAVKRAIRFS